MTDRLDAAISELVAALRDEMRATTAPAAPRAFSVAETASLIGVSRSVLYKIIGAGALRTRKVGSRRLVTAVALDEFLNLEGRLP